MLTPASRQMSTRRVASSTPEFPHARKNSLAPPNVPVPRLRTGTFRPERPRILNSMMCELLGCFGCGGAAQSFAKILAGKRERGKEAGGGRHAGKQDAERVTAETRRKARKSLLPRSRDQDAYVRRIVTAARPGRLGLGLWGCGRSL